MVQIQLPQPSRKLRFGNNCFAIFAVSLVCSFSPEQPHKSYNLWGPPNLAIFGGLHYTPKISRFSGDPTTPQKSHDFQGTPLHPKNLTIFGDPIDCGQQVRFLLQVKDLWVISEGYSNFALSKKSLLTPILVATKEVLKKACSFCLPVSTRIYLVFFNLSAYLIKSKKKMLL